VSYNSKHNEANAEDHRDGTDTGRGTAAPKATEDPEVLSLRSPQRCDFLATLLLSQGMPIL
jgi:glycogen operon protein